MFTALMTNNFGNLCHQIEREVDDADWKSGGHTTGEASWYDILGQTSTEDDSHEDEGGWTGGEFVLGGGGNEASALSRREILAQTAMKRQRSKLKRRRSLATQRKKAGVWRQSHLP
ncbi:hypothetical protein E4U58_004872 [Claviceps cyperi]|nr:hypothetical protein E4U58_004872 [Claviceps cyperi]